jgi:hypothetical protein
VSDLPEFDLQLREPGEVVQRSLRAIWSIQSMADLRRDLGLDAGRDHRWVVRELDGPVRDVCIYCGLETVEDVDAHTTLCPESEVDRGS